MRRPKSKRARPLEYTLLYAATLFLLAIGAVMVYSASSATSLLHGSGDPSFYLKRYVVFGILGLVDERCGGVFDDIDAVIPAAEREAFMARYKAAAGFAIETLNAAPPTIAPGARARAS